MRELELRPLTPELESALSDQHFGGEKPAGGFTARVGNQPIAFPLRAVYAALGLTIPAQLDLYKHFEIWLVPHVLSIHRRSGLAEVTSAGFECEFVTGGRTLSVVELIPAPAFVQHGSIGGKFSCEGNLSASGGASPANPEGAAQPGAGILVNKAGLDFGVATDASITASFQLTVSTPLIHALGVGSNRVEWRFERDQDPLFGTDIRMYSIIVVPKRQSKVVMRARASMTTRTAFFPTRSETDWCELRCPLEA